MIALIFTCEFGTSFSLLLNHSLLQPPSSIALLACFSTTGGQNGHYYLRGEQKAESHATGEFDCLVSRGRRALLHSRALARQSSVN